MEAKTQGLQKTIDKYERETAKLYAELNAAGGEPDEETRERIETIEQEKADLKAKLKHAEQKIKAAQKEGADARRERDKVLEENIGLEKDLGETRETVEELRGQVARLAKEQNDDPGKAQFSAYFNLTKNAFNGMLEAVGKIEDGQEKYRKAVVKMLEAMIETVKEC